MNTLFIMSGILLTVVFLYLKQLDKSIRTIKNGIKGLIDNNMIERVGSNKKGYWNVIGEYKNDD